MKKVGNESLPPEGWIFRHDDEEVPYFLLMTILMGHLSKAVKSLMYPSTRICSLDY